MKQNNRYWNDITTVSYCKNVMMSLSYIYYTEILMLNIALKFQLVNTEVFNIAMQQFQFMSMNNNFYHILQVYGV